MDWADAYSLGRLPSLYPYLLLILDKFTEYWATYPSEMRDTGTPVELLKQHITTTGSTRRYLRIDNTKEFTSQETVDFCSDKTFILQPVAAYNLTMQAYVEDAIGCAKQYSRVVHVCANIPTHF